MWASRDVIASRARRLGRAAAGPPRLQRRTHRTRPHQPAVGPAPPDRPCPRRAARRAAAGRAREMRPRPRASARGRGARFVQVVTPRCSAHDSAHSASCPAATSCRPVAGDVRQIQAADAVQGAGDRGQVRRAPREVGVKPEGRPSITSKPSANHRSSSELHLRSPPLVKSMARPQEGNVAQQPRSIKALSSPARNERVDRGALGGRGYVILVAVHPPPCPAVLPCQRNRPRLGQLPGSKPAFTHKALMHS